MPIQDLRTFADGMADIIGRPSLLRPFVCDGSPLDCSVFIVGYNPATLSDRDFWTDWGPEGYDKTGWMEAYVAERAARPLKPGKKFRHRVSPSRRVIEQVVAAAAVPILETNVFAQPSPDMASLEEHDVAPFRYLVRTLQPRLIVAHGKEAAHAVEKLDINAHVLQVPHFSRGWSREKARALGHEIREFTCAEASEERRVHL